MKILQVGLGRWGANHLRVWHELRQELYVAELDQKQHSLCEVYNLDKSKISSNYHDFLSKVDAVDIVTPTDSHFPLAQEALQAGKDLFIEKPITVTAQDALALAELAEKQGRILQVGHIFRYNPSTQYIKQQIDSGRLGKIRYMTGYFMGFKRARTDVGVTHTDSIHFFDLFTYFLGKSPQSVMSVMRDFFGRGLEDTSVTFLNYGDTLAKVESGYLPPGNHRTVTIMGDKATLVSDVVSQQVEIHDNHHELKNGTWVAVEGGVTRPKITLQEPLYLELKHFVECVGNRQKPLSDVWVGYQLSKIVEAAVRSAKEKREVSL